MKTRTTHESQIVRQILDYLRARHIFAMRVNTGRIMIPYKGKHRMFQAHNLGIGCADILIVPPDSIWIECKRPDGEQTIAQKLFQQHVTETFGHQYVVAHSIDDLEGFL